MPLQKLPVVDLDNVNHRRGARERINAILDHSFDDSKARTLAEVATDITVVNAAFPPGDVRRWGVVPNDPQAAAINAAIMKNAFDPTKAGPIGTFLTPDTTGEDIYYFGDWFDVRPDVHFNLCSSTWFFTKAYAAADDTRGFVNMICNNSIYNGKIVVDYDGSAGSNAGMAIRCGSRDGYPFGQYTAGIFEGDDGVAFGNLVFRDLEITTNNSGPAGPILMFGGIRNLVVENVKIDGQNACVDGILYEFGVWSTNGSANRGDWTSSHGHNMHFKNLSIVNLDDSQGIGAGLDITGAYMCTVDNLYVNGAYGGFIFRPGEALFFRVAPGDDPGAKRGMTLRNITGVNILNTGCAFVGAELASSGYLSGEGLTNAQQSDLMIFSLDGFSFANCGQGVFFSGPATIRNGNVRGCGHGIVALDDCIQFNIENVRVLDSTDIGIRMNQAGVVPWSRKKLGAIRNSQIAGSVGPGIAFGDGTQSVLIENNRIGYTNGYDGQPENTQTVGVNVSSDAYGVVCRGNYVATSGGAVAYNMQSGGTDTSRGCGISNAMGPVTTYTGDWRGVWHTSTPTITCSTPGNLAITYTQQHLTYNRSIEGDRVDYVFRFDTSAFTHTTASGTLIIQNLPYTVNSAAWGRCQAALSFRGITKAGFTQFTPETVPGTTQINIIASGTGAAFTSCDITDLPTGGSVVLRGAGHYFI